LPAASGEAEQLAITVAPARHSCTDGGTGAHTSSHSSTPRRNAGICAQPNTSPAPNGTSSPPMVTQPGPLYAAADVKQRFSANTS